MTLVIYNHFRYFMGFKKKKYNAGYPTVTTLKSPCFIQRFIPYSGYIFSVSLEGFTPSGNLADSR